MTTDKWIENLRYYMIGYEKDSLIYRQRKGFISGLFFAMCMGNFISMDQEMELRKEMALWDEESLKLQKETKNEFH